jgi:hypothetical protein
MAFELTKFINRRPFLYHLTALENLVHIRENRSITCASELMKSAGRTDLLRRKRGDHEGVQVGGKKILLRDQSPLHQGNLRLPGGYTFEDFVESLNARVFFWPGTALGPIAYGMRHFERYKGEKPAILRVQFDSLVTSNPLLKPLFCRYNSGVPRCSYGEKSPRGPDTFLEGIQFSGPPSNVVEVTFEKWVLLPPDTEYGYHPHGKWLSLSSK